MTRKGKAAASPAGPEGAELALARLGDLDRDQLSVLLFLSLPRDRAIELMKRLNVSLTGFRPEGLGDIQRSDLLADEFAADPTRRRAILKALQRDLAPLPDARETLGPAAAVLGPLFAAEAGAARAVVRLLSDPGPAVRQVGLEVLNALADYYLGAPEPLPEGAEAAEPEARPGGPPPDPTEALRRELTRARERADTAERERQARADQLQQARREAAESKATVGDLRRLLAAAEAERDRLQGRLTELAAAPHSAAELRLRKEAEELKERIERLEEERRVLRIEEARLKVALARAASPEKAPPEPPKPVPAAEEEMPEEAPPTWLMPVFTKEFYDSLPGWERRLQRAAFQKAMLLALDHRHPSLRALPLEGLPNLWRIRIATDVRLLYRRGEGNVIEVLRLIDREDLDRWIKVEKLRT